MGHIDEKILREQMNEKKNKEQEESKLHNSMRGSVLEGKITMGDNEYLFANRFFLDGKMQIFMPDDLREMTDEEIRTIYVMGNKPQYLYTSESLGISFVINHTQNPVTNQQVPAMASMAGKLMEKVSPNGKIYQKNKYVKNDKTICTFEMISNGIDDNVFTLNYYASLDEKLLLGNLSFGSRNIKNLRPIVSMMMDTMIIG